MPRHWELEDFALIATPLGEPVEHIAKTVCLLESRCDDYADYLRAIFLDRDPVWNAAIDRWNSEECLHGELLRRLGETVDPEFRFDDFMARYTSRVRYHAATGVSVRGSVGAELVSRCVVEALASTLYRVLADAAGREDGHRVFSALAQDEARHFAMFLKMLDAEAASSGRLGRWRRAVYALRRMIELEDGQIMVASCIVARRDDHPARLRNEAHRYLADLYGLYRWKHLRYAARMLIRTVDVRPTRLRVALATGVLWVGIKLRGTWARILRGRSIAVVAPRAATGHGPRAGRGSQPVVSEP